MVQQIGTKWNRETRNTINNNDQSLQNQLNNIVLGDGSLAEVEQARVALDGTNYNTLKERLDTENEEVKNLSSNVFADNDRLNLFYKLYDLDKNGGTVTMVGDSLTGGVSSGGHPYYEPFETWFPNITFINEGVGGNTSKDILDRVTDIADTNADLYIIACGTNDVRYQNSNSATTGSEYVSVINDIITALGEADFVLINPWPAFDEDTSSVLAYKQRDDLTDEFSNSLALYCENNGYPFIETNKFLRSVIDWGNKGTVLVDSIHPKHPEGIQLYADTVLFGNVNSAAYGLEKTKAIGKHLYRIEITEVSDLETEFDNISIHQLYTDQTIEEIWTDNYRSGYYDPDSLISGYDENFRFSNRVGQYPVNITFSTNEPITELHQLESALHRMIGKYKIHYSSDPYAIVDMNHVSWSVIYESLDANNGIGTLLYQEPYLKMEENHYYMLEIVPKGSGVRLAEVSPDVKIIRHNGKTFSSLDPVTSNIVVGHHKVARTGSSSSAFYFFSTNSKIRNVLVDFDTTNVTCDLILSHAERFESLPDDETDGDWDQIAQALDVSDANPISIDVPNH